MSEQPKLSDLYAQIIIDHYKHAPDFTPPMWASLFGIAMWGGALIFMLIMLVTGKL